MKKILSLLLVLTMVLSLCACAGSDANEGGESKVEGLSVGYSKVNITPEFSVGLGGYSDAETRKSEGFVDYIYATCIAATDGDETILMYTIDTCAMAHSTAEKIRGLVTAATGVPGEKIFVGATHCHSCPSLTTAADGVQYTELLMDAVVKAAQDALADRSAAAIEVATPVIEGMNFVRHYKLEDGSYAGSNFGDFSRAPAVEHATETDPQMVLLKFDRAEDKKDVLLVNWQGHPDSASSIGYKTIAASWIGPLRDKLEELSGMEVAYFTGASGNQNISSQIQEEKHFLEWRQYGEKMGEIANEALAQLKPIEGSGINTNRVTFAAEIDHSWDPMLEQANEVYDLWKSQGKAAGDALGKTYNFTSSYQARAIKSRAKLGLTQDLELNTFNIGPIGFTTGTYEMFSDAGLYVKRNSPFEVTVIITGNSGYIPSEAAYDYRSYEADTGMYAKGTAEKLAEKYVEMLNALK